MKLWEKYTEEREGAKIIYNDFSFVTYRQLNENEIMIIDVFVEKEHRKSGATKKLWDELIEKTKPKVTYGCTDREALNWESSHKFMLALGFIPYTEEGAMIFYYKEIE
jgi:predicted GNAT family acetyltransferase